MNKLEEERVNPRLKTLYKMVESQKAYYFARFCYEYANDKLFIDTNRNSATGIGLIVRYNPKADYPNIDLEQLHYRQRYMKGSIEAAMGEYYSQYGTPLGLTYYYETNGLLLMREVVKFSNKYNAIKMKLLNIVTPLSLFNPLWYTDEPFYFGSYNILDISKPASDRNLRNALAGLRSQADFMIQA